MTRRMLLSLLLCLFGALLLSYCESSGEDDDDDNNNVSDVDDDNDDNDNNDNDNDTVPNGQFPISIEQCPEPYQENPVWFEVKNFQNKAEIFSSLYGLDFVTGNVELNGDTITLATSIWSVDIEWQTENPQPFIDGQVVTFFAGFENEPDMFTSGRPLLWVLDENGDLLIYHDTRVFSGAMQFDFLSRAYSLDYYCEYKTGQPPLGDDVHWLRVFDLSLIGSVGGVAFWVEPSADSRVSTDGLYDVYLPVSYDGATDFEGTDCCDFGKAILQIVKRPTTD